MTTRQGPAEKRGFVFCLHFTACLGFSLAVQFLPEVDLDDLASMPPPLAGRIKFDLAALRMEFVVGLSACKPS